MVSGRAGEAWRGQGALGENRPSQPGLGMGSPRQPPPQMDTVVKSLPPDIRGPRSRLEGVSELIRKGPPEGEPVGSFQFQPELSSTVRATGSTHPLLLVPIHLQRRPAVPARPPGHEGVLVIPEHHLLLLGRGGGGLGGNIVGPRCVQPMDGVGQQLAVADGDQLPGLQAHTPRGR